VRPRSRHGPACALVRPDRRCAPAGSGYETIPLKTCVERGIVVTRLPGQNARAVAELAVALTLGVLRRVPEFDRRMRRGEVLPSIDWLSPGADGRTVGLVGMGEIARSYAWRMSVRASHVFLAMR
jgi:phosphoglycerate dehydrogenase-like enzyme